MVRGLLLSNQVQTMVIKDFWTEDELEFDAEEDELKAEEDN
jgi:hypothetical protein